MSTNQLPKPISFDWDKYNKDKNWHKHQVNHKECEEVFFNNPIRFYPDTKHSKIEKRVLALGITNNDIMLTIIFTIRNKNIRVISARHMSKKERNIYVSK